MKVYKSLDELPTTLNVKDVAIFLNISRAGAYNLVKKDGFPILKIGARIVVPKEAFIRWVEENTGKL